MQTLADLYPLDKTANAPDAAAAFFAAASKPVVAATTPDLIARQALGNDYPLFAETWRLLSIADRSLGFSWFQTHFATVKDLLQAVRRPSRSFLHPALQAAAFQDHQIRKLLEVDSYFAQAPSHPIEDLHTGPAWLLSGVQTQFLTADMLAVDSTPTNSPMFFPSGLNWSTVGCSAYAPEWPQKLSNAWKGFQRKKLVDVLPDAKGHESPALENLYALGASLDLAELEVFRQMDAASWERWLTMTISLAASSPSTFKNKLATQDLLRTAANIANSVTAV